VDILVKLNGMFLHSETFKFERIYDEGDNVEFKYSSYVPSFAPAGTYSMSFVFNDAANNNLGCFSFSWKL
jgi:hypothetical protein